MRISSITDSYGLKLFISVLDNGEATVIANYGVAARLFRAAR